MLNKNKKANKLKLKKPDDDEKCEKPVYTNQLKFCNFADNISEVL